MTFNARHQAQHQADLFAEYPLTDYSTEERAEIAATQAYDLCREPNHTDIIAWLEIMAKALPELTVLVEACHDEVERLYREATENDIDLARRDASENWDMDRDEAYRSSRG